MKMKRVRVFFLSNTTRTSDENIRKVIQDNHNGNPRIKIERSNRALDSRCLIDLLYRVVNRGHVYIILDEFSKKSIKQVTDTGMSFSIISMNNIGWTSSCINEVMLETADKSGAEGISDSQMAH